MLSSDDMSHFTKAIRRSLTDNANKQFVTLKKDFAYKRYKYSDIHNYIVKTITWLEKQKIKAGDRVIICSYNSPQYIYVYLACVFSGVVLVPLDFAVSDQLIKKIIEKTKPKLMFTSVYKITEPKIPVIRMEELNELLAGCKKSTLSSKTTKNDLVQILYTSGTTGEPKGVMLTHDNIYSNIQSVSTVFEFKPSFITLSMLPLSHIFEQIAMLSLLIHGAQTVQMKSRRGSEIIKLLHHEPINTLVTVPAFLQLFKAKIEDGAKQQGKYRILKKMLHIATYLPHNLRLLLLQSIHKKLGGSIKRMIIGGAPLSENLEDFWDNLGIEITKGYGLTETSPILTATYRGQRKTGAVGKTIPGVSLKIAKNGEILAKGPNIMKGYYKKTAETKKVFTKDGWFKTGDIGEINNDGYVFIKGRVKNVIIKSNGKNIHPEDIEQHLNKDKRIKEAIVVGIPHKKEILTAAVLLTHKPTKKTTFKTLIEKTNKKLEKYQQIEETFIWPETDFPRTHTLKVKRRLIVDELTKNHKNSTHSDDALIQILSSITNKQPKSIKEKSQLGIDLGIDSLRVIKLAITLEEQLRISIPEHKLTPTTTVKQLRDIVSKNTHQKRDVFKLPNSMFSSWFEPIKKVWPRLVRLLLNINYDPLLVEGRKHLQNLPDQLIIISNHQSHMDVPLLMSEFPDELKAKISFASRYDYFFENKNLKQRVLSFIFTHFGGAFPLVRDFNEHRHSVLESFDLAAEIVDRGWSIFIFPEGTRNPNDTLLPFKKGLGLIIKEFNLPVLPIKISGHNKILPKGSNKPLGKHKVSLTFGKPQYFYHKDTPEKITKDLQKIIQNM